MQGAIFESSEYAYHARLFRIPLGAVSNQDRLDYEELMVILLNPMRTDMFMATGFAPARSIDSREGVAYVFLEWVVMIDGPDSSEPDEQGEGANMFDF